MKGRILILFILLSNGFYLNGQISQGGKPMLTKAYKSLKQPYLVPEEKIETKILSVLSQQEQYTGKKPLSIAVNESIEIDINKSGSWIRVSEDLNIWRMEFYSPGAKGLSIFFNKFRLSENAMLFLYNPSMDFVLGGFNHKTNKKSGVLQTAFVPGNRLIIELQVKNGKNYGEFSIGDISHAFVDMFNSTQKKDGYYGSSGSCEVDINCQEGAAWQTIKRSVCRIIFRRYGFTTDVCTGTLINNTSVDGKALFYTANHCIKRVSEAESAVIYFGYESPECDGIDGDASLTLSSAEILATSDSLDFTLLELSEDPPESYKPYFAGWSRNPLPPQRSVTIHHPRGDVKKISRDDDPALIEYQTENPPSWLYNGAAPEAFWRIEDWEVGATEGGSSGCPLFNPAKLIVGNLTGGDANCINPVNDYFSKFYLNWDYYPEPNRQLMPWLDPLNSDVQFLDGYDPYDIPDPFEIELFEVYPNPGDGLFTLYTDTLDLSTANIKIFDLKGSIIADYALTSLQDVYLDLRHFENGIYIIEIRVEGILERKKIVILK